MTRFKDMPVANIDDNMGHILGDGTYIRPWVDEKLKEISCEIL